jgi:hypothetical protein
MYGRKQQRRLWTERRKLSNKIWKQRTANQSISKQCTATE